MNGIDIVCLLVLLWGAWRGWRKGFIRGVLSLVGWVVGLVLACLFFREVGCVLAGHMGEYASWSLLAAFLLIAFGVPFLCVITGWLLTGLFKLVQLGLVNSLAGTLFGVVKYALVLSLLINLLAGTVQWPEPEMRTTSLLYEPLRSLLGSAVDWCNLLPDLP